MTSGYKCDQIIRIVVSGIKGYKARVMRCVREGRSLYRTAAQSSHTRRRKKLLGKTEWYRQKKSGAVEEEGDVRSEKPSRGEAKPVPRGEAV